MKPGTNQAPMSLRQSQVTLLLREMAHSAGVKVDIRHRDAHRGIALVDFLDQVDRLMIIGLLGIIRFCGTSVKSHQTVHSVGNDAFSIYGCRFGSRDGSSAIIPICITRFTSAIEF